MRRLKFNVLFLSVFLCCMATGVQAGELINQHLPKWVNVDLQFRYRYESPDNLDFNDTLEDDESFHLKRTRLGITLKPVEQWKLFYQLQDSRIENDGFENNTPYENYADTRQLYLEGSKLFSLDAVDLSGVGVRLGRQELSYGAQRLVGGFGWSNIAQTFDAAKMMLNFEPHHLTIDGFGGTFTQINSPDEADDLFEGEAHDNIGGYYATYKGIKDVTVENYLIRRKTNKNITYISGVTAGELDIFTTGGRVVGKVPDSKFDYELEAAHQWGSTNALDVSANMLVTILGYTFDHPWKPRAAFEFDYASGDSDTSDADLNTFNNLYPTNHLQYGYMDRAGLQNLNDYRFQLKAKPTEKLALQGDLHLIFVDTPKDAFYAAGRTALRTPPAASDVNTHVGNEVDLTANYKLCKYADLLVGYSHFFAGKYLQETGANDEGDFFYVETTFNF
ncbi:MAG TPA: hypothetical protein DD723_06915 [Candidatus Omnitrophica bacterium]|uniref:Alginate export domain-containing protein n=1 Tax=Candidatus Kaiserbacteria bacterium GW2011_GWA2_49_19 TaxID=1618669 RepID=A0A0G1VR07_9BACT|nr:MAG: hypothetical protein UY44_C0006G0023 [Candidatus Kaiserbacteria bacterium GW2011_GWA2_49_19]HBR15255.1 hypothetical protein [Candidatus Omnitrophota bacterium]